MGIWDKEKRTFTNPNKAIEGVFKGIGIMELYLYQYPQAALNNKMGNFD